MVVSLTELLGVHNMSHEIWSVVPEHVSRARTSKYILQYVWDVITCSCPWYVLLTQHSCTQFYFCGGVILSVMCWFMWFISPFSLLLFPWNWSNFNGIDWFAEFNHLLLSMGFNGASRSHIFCNIGAKSDPRCHPMSSEVKAFLYLHFVIMSMAAKSFWV